MVRLGYPCLNYSIGALADRTFRLASYTDERCLRTADANLEALGRLIEFNAEHGLGFIRISSQTVPFASHPVCKAPWKRALADRLKSLGEAVRRHGLRVSMHPDQFTLLNAPDPRVVARSSAELLYHLELLNALGTGPDAKIQIHVGGVYGDKASAIGRFLSARAALPEELRARLVIENDERLFSVRDCLRIHEAAGIPILLDTFHHELFPDGYDLPEAFALCRKTWTARDGVPMLDYSSARPGGRFGEHAHTLDEKHFRAVMSRLQGADFDVILEIKDKEKSALRALRSLRAGGSRRAVPCVS